MRIRTEGARRGGALLAVLWLSMALSVIAFAVASRVRGETERSATGTESLRAYYLAAGSIDRAVLWIDWGTMYSNLDGSPRYYRAPMPIIRYSYATGEVLVEVIPEAGKMNVNEASETDLERLLIASGLENDRALRIAQGIVSYRQAGEGDPAGPAPGDGSTFRPRHASFEELEEILLVPGMTPDIFFGRFDRDPSGRLIPRGGLRECLTVWGASGVVDVNTAPPVLLESLGLSSATAMEIVKRRDVKPFKTMDEVVPYIANAGPQAARLGVGVGARIWTLRATARGRLPGGKLSEVRRTVAAVVKILDSARYNPPFHILRWYDDAWSPGVIPF